MTQLVFQVAQLVTNLMKPIQTHNNVVIRSVDHFHDHFLRPVHSKRRNGGECHSTDYEEAEKGHNNPRHR
jgi:hypothetical protein